MDFFKHNQITDPQKGDLLISDPFLPDPNFERSVVLLCEHNEEGSLGFILNKKSSLLLSDILNEFDGFDLPVFIGGPVEQNTLHYVHRLGSKISDSIEVADDIYWGGSFEEIKWKVRNGELDNQDIVFFIGYSGWGEMQLNEELSANSWIVSKESKSSYIFDKDPELLWKEILKDMGGKYKMFANYPADPRLN